MTLTLVRTRPSTTLRLILGLILTSLALWAAEVGPAPAAAQFEPEVEGTLGPVRDVLLVGDSIMRSTGPALAHQLGDRCRVHNEGVNGSGLLTPGVFPWPRHLAASLNRFDPDLVVMLFIGNYTATPPRSGSAPTVDWSPTSTRRPSPGSGGARPSGS